VSYITRPVTQVAEVAVNSASMKLTLPVFIDIGSIKRIVPTTITAKKLKATSLGYEA
jgi:hypothetical protein